jgi:multiple antibiotic resistance protein
MTAELLLAAGKSFLFVFAAILPILNPAATAPIFLGLTEGASRARGPCWRGASRATCSR